MKENTEVKPRKILFLDIDGVLNSYRNVIANKRFPFPNRESEKELDPLALGMIRRLCDECGVEIILSSTWRKDVDPVEFGKKWDLPITGRTSTYCGKPMAIGNWLADNPDVKIYATIDDDNMSLPKGKQVFTHINDGMLSKHYHELVEIFMSTKGNYEEETADLWRGVVP